MTSQGLVMRVGCVVLSALAVVPLVACPQEPAANAQDTPENLVATVLGLREQGRAEEAARYFINNDTKVTELVGCAATRRC